MYISLSLLCIPSIFCNCECAYSFVCTDTLPLPHFHGVGRFAIIDVLAFCRGKAVIRTHQSTGRAGETRKVNTSFLVTVLPYLLLLTPNSPSFAWSSLECGDQGQGRSARCHEGGAAKAGRWRQDSRAEAAEPGRQSQGN